jgi:hypothetical protein
MDQSRAEHFRKKAEECRELAKRARDPDVRAQLYKLAADWIALAERIKVSHES